MYKVERPGLEHFGLVEPIVQIVAEEIQVVWLVRKSPVLIEVQGQPASRVYLAHRLPYMGKMSIPVT
jgi:hypothetical protein